MKIMVPLLLAVIFLSCSNPPTDIENDSMEVTDKVSNEVILSEDLNWEKLNPARGDKSPQAATIWGDRNANVPTGFLVKFVDGFSSPPHIHNVSYRAVVIDGLVHNNEPNAESIWMPSGSFWTQPAGDAHITSASGETNIAYVEIEEGPYLVQPMDDAYDNGERPLNIHASNVTWLDKTMVSWIKSNSDVEISMLWDTKEKNGLSGYFVKIPSEFKGELISQGTTFQCIVVSGKLNYSMPENQQVKQLDPGSFFRSTNRAIHQLSNTSKDSAILYIRTNSDFVIQD